MNVIVIIHISVCIFLIMLVLLQAGKGLGMGSSLGGSSQALFDTRETSSVLGKATTVAAVIFMLTSLTMGYMRSREVGSIITNNSDLIMKYNEFSPDNKQTDFTILEPSECENDPASTLNTKVD